MLWFYYRGAFPCQDCLHFSLSGQQQKLWHWTCCLFGKFTPVLDVRFLDSATIVTSILWSMGETLYR